jgi:heme/copper-type cytochrome/quinol oxidase subunit 2
VRRALILVPILLLVVVGLFFLLRPNSPATEPSSGTSTSGSTEGSQEKTFDLTIKGATMTPNEITVGEGDRVRLRITSDAPLEFHLHGYDLAKEVEASEPAELPFDATITGRFEIENEQTHEELGALLVQPR